MRPPTEVERLAVFLAAVAVTRLMLGRGNVEHAAVDAYARRMGHDRPIEERLEKLRRISGQGPVVDRRSPTDPYRARYGANNPGVN